MRGQEISYWWTRNFEEFLYNYRAEGYRNNDDSLALGSPAKRNRMTDGSQAREETSQELLRDQTGQPSKNGLVTSDSWNLHLDRVLPVVLLTCGVFLYLEAFILPNTPRAPFGDQSIYLQHGSRMLAGERIYRDYDHFTLPGTDVLYWGLFRLFGVRAWIPQAMLVLIGVTLSWLSISISKWLMVGAKVFLPALLFVTLALSSYLDATHHWYSAVFTTAALAVLIEHRNTKRISVAGALWGVATCFTQSAALGILGLAYFLYWESEREEQARLLRSEAALIGSFLAVVVVFNAYFIRLVGLKKFLWYTAVFLVKYYPADSFNTWRIYLHDWPSRHEWTNLPDLAGIAFLHVLIPVVYVLAFLRYRFQDQVDSRREGHRLMLVTVTGLTLFLTIASSPAYNRMCTISIPAFIVLGWLAGFPGKLESLVSRGLMIAALLMMLLKPTITQTRWEASLTLPAGRVAFSSPAEFQKLSWLSERTRPSDYFFGDQLACFLLHLRNPARVPFLRPTDCTRPEEVDDLVQALEAHRVRFVSLYPGLDIAGPGNHLAPLLVYLHDHYHVVQTFINGDRIWERNQPLAPDVVSYSLSQPTIRPDSRRRRNNPGGRKSSRGSD
jgi:hypothetical protein